MPTDSFRGHPIEERGGAFYFLDTGEPTAETWKDRPCGACGLMSTPEGHDGCLGTLPPHPEHGAVVNACCGHGVAADAYVQYADGAEVRGGA